MSDGEKKMNGIHWRIIIMLAKRHMAFRMLTYPGYLHQRVAIWLNQLDIEWGGE